jgi:hypothetical protein
MPTSVAPVPRTYSSGMAIRSGGVGGHRLPDPAHRMDRKSLPEFARIRPIGAIPFDSIIAALFCRFAQPPLRRGGAAIPPSSAIRSIPMTVRSSARSRSRRELGGFVRAILVSLGRPAGFVSQSCRPPTKPVGFVSSPLQLPPCFSASRHFGRLGFVSQNSNVVLALFGCQYGSVGSFAQKVSPLRLLMDRRVVRVRRVRAIRPPNSSRWSKVP